jgi:hypothetical protein
MTIDEIKALYEAAKAKGENLYVCHRGRCGLLVTSVGKSVVVLAQNSPWANNNKAKIHARPEGLKLSN